MKSLLRRRQLRPQDNQLKQPCTLYKKIMHTQNGSLEESWDCLLDPSDGDIFVTTPSELDLSDAISGETTLFAPGLAVAHQEVVIQDISQAVLGESTRRRHRHLSVTGGLDVVVVRVSCVSGQKVTKSLMDVMHDVFEDTICLKSQMEGCSSGKVQINKGPNNGGIDLEIADCSSESAASNAATATLTSILGNHPSNYPKTHFMYCMPPGIGFGGIAYAYVNSWLSVYNNDWCGYVSAQLHEIGHNLNLAHAGEDSDEYGDQTGVMGYSYSLDDMSMCFNAPNMFQLGWLDQVVEFTSQPSSAVWSLVGHTNFGGGLQAVRLIGTPSSQDTYIWFNHVAGIHSQTQEGANQVIVTTRPAGTGYAESLMVAKLVVGGTYNPGNTYFSLHVISIENGSAQITLQPPTPAPEIVPTAAPVPAPTLAPTPPPTAAPIPSPTLAPTDAPVVVPTHAPVPPPTAAPVPPPTRAPTAAPVPSPTRAPVRSPTRAPVRSPTRAPVRSPTRSPVRSPTRSPVRSPTRAAAPVRSPTRAAVRSPTSTAALVRSPTR